MSRRRWTDAQLQDAVRQSFSIRQTIFKLGLIPAGGNYLHIKRSIKSSNIDTSHFTGQGWSKGSVVSRVPMYSLSEILVADSNFNRCSLKKRLFKVGLKKPACEECGWAQVSEDGRIPIELDHINGKNNDNRLENLRILCPNCHSLKSTHRGRNKARRGGGIGYTRRS